MKKRLLPLVLCCIVFLAACSANTNTTKRYEEQFIGKWATSSGDKAIIYSFYIEDGEYKAGCVTSGYNVYMFDKYTATGKTITLYQDGKTTKYYYSFEDGYLYMDGLEFEPFN